MASCTFFFVVVVDDEFFLYITLVMYKEMKVTAGQQVSMHTHNPVRPTLDPFPFCIFVYVCVLHDRASTLHFRIESHTV